MTTASDVARFLIHLASSSNDAEDDTLCNMRLQKLVYYTQAWHLAASGVPLFTDRIEAWEHGPVVRSLYNQFKTHKLAIPPSEGSVADDLSLGDREFIESIWNRYKDFSGTGLRNLTHREAPWSEAWSKRDPNDRYSNIEITQDAMRTFFLPRFVELLKREDARIDLAKWKSSAEAIASGRIRKAGDLRRELRIRHTGPGA
jgi:uncharacterized phage-associated protein